MEQATVEPETATSVNKKKLTKGEKRKSSLQVEDLEMQILRDEMINETNNITKIMKERSQRWLAMCEQRNDPQLRDAVHTVWKAFERANDSKDALIKELVNTLNKERELSDSSFRETGSHVETMVSEFNQIAKKKRARMQYEMTMYNENRNATGNRLYHTHRARIGYLKEIDYFEYHYQSKGDTLKAETILRNKNRILARNLKDRALWGDKHIAELRNVWDSYKTTVHDYRLKESLMNAKTKEMSAKVGKSDNIIQNQETQIARMTEKVNRLKRNLEEERQSLALSDLRSDRAQLQNRRRLLNARWKKKEMAAKENLRNLTWSSLQTIRKLETIHEKGDRILRLRTQCRQLQTTEEQNAPLPKKGRESYYSQTLSVWQEYKKAELMYKAMRSEKEFLLEWNKDLEAYVKKYFCEIGLSMLPIRSLFNTHP